jgi:hypothetical protein
MISKSSGWDCADAVARIKKMMGSHVLMVDFIGVSV